MVEETECPWIKFDELGYTKFCHWGEERENVATVKEFSEQYCRNCLMGQLVDSVNSLNDEAKKCIRS